eukprot:2622782-Amphidinium_carterae.1
MAKLPQKASNSIKYYAKQYLNYTLPVMRRMVPTNGQAIPPACAKRRFCRSKPRMKWVELYMMNSRRVIAS